MSYYYDYNHFKSDIKTITTTIQFKSPLEKIDHIIGLSRGGLIPAVAISHALKLPMTPMVFSKKGSRIYNQTIIDLIVSGKTLLIVDDIVDTGKIIQELISFWQESLVEDIDLQKLKIAALINYRHKEILYSNNTGDLYCNYTGLSQYNQVFSSKPFIDFFWEKLDN